MPDNGPTISVPLERRDNGRRADRVFASMPVTIDGVEATTQDLSSTGLSFQSDRPYEVGARVDVLIEYLLDGAQYPLRCQAEVVRVAACEGGYSIGARLMPDQSLQQFGVADADDVAPEAGVARQPLRPVD
jgi:hypothetical protein